MEPTSKKEWRRRILENWKSARGNAPHEVTHDVFTMLGLLALLRAEPMDVQDQAGKAVTAVVGDGTTDAAVDRAKHPLLNCWRNALAHPGLIGFEPEDGAVKNLEIETVVLRDAKDVHTAHHWELKIQVGQLPRLIEILAGV